MPWDQALDIPLKSTGLEMVEYDDVITVLDLEASRGGAPCPPRRASGRHRAEPLQTDYIRVVHVKAAELARLLGGSGTTSAAAAATDSITGGVQQVTDSPS